MPASNITKALIGNSVLICCLFMLASGNKEGKVIPWDANNKLTWKDFKDTAVNNAHRAALTASGFRMEASAAGSSIEIHVYSEMYPDKSWVDSTRKSDHLLSHEQYHFNISEYWSRRLKKDLGTTRFTKKNFNEKMGEINRENLRQCREMEEQYDAETNHSIIAPEQEKWEKKIDDLLKSTEKYTASTITVPLK